MTAPQIKRSRDKPQHAGENKCLFHVLALRLTDDQKATSASEAPATDSG